MRCSPFPIVNRVLTLVVLWLLFVGGVARRASHRCRCGCWRWCRSRRCHLRSGCWHGWPRSGCFGSGGRYFSAGRCYLVMRLRSLRSRCGCLRSLHRWLIARCGHIVRRCHLGSRWLSVHRSARSAARGVFHTSCRLRRRAWVSGGGRLTGRSLMLNPSAVVVVVVRGAVRGVALIIWIRRIAT